jgi:rubrerythrin
MATTNTKAIDTLLDLLQLDGDAIQLYDQALEHVDDFDVRTDLEAFRADHERHVGDLTKLVFDLGGDVPPANLDLKGELLRALTELRSATGTRGALKAMRMNERITNRAYEKAIGRPLPETAIYTITRNLADERRHREAIQAHLTRLGHEDEAAVEAADPSAQAAKAEDVALPPRQ